MLEKNSLIGIARSLGISISYKILSIVFYRSIACQMQVLPETPTDIEWECDEICHLLTPKKTQFIYG